MTDTQARVDLKEKEDFPEIDIDVAPIGERSRTIFAKTHNRPGISNLEDVFAPDSK